MSCCGSLPECNQNANDPNAPEFDKGWKLLNNSIVGRGTNITTIDPYTQPGAETVTTKKLTRQDFT